jgi:hypothetical protein
MTVLLRYYLFYSVFNLDYFSSPITVLSLQRDIFETQIFTIERLALDSALYVTGFLCRRRACDTLKTIISVYYFSSKRHRGSLRQQERTVPTSAHLNSKPDGRRGASVPF